MPSAIVMTRARSDGLVQVRGQKHGATVIAHGQVQAPRRQLVAISHQHSWPRSSETPVGDLEKFLPRASANIRPNRYSATPSSSIESRRCSSKDTESAAIILRRHSADTVWRISWPVLHSQRTLRVAIVTIVRPTGVGQCLDRIRGPCSPRCSSGIHSRGASRASADAVSLYPPGGDA
jgi:hypothetical protein